MPEGRYWAPVGRLWLVTILNAVGLVVLLVMYTGTTGPGPEKHYTRDMTVGALAGFALSVSCLIAATTMLFTKRAGTAVGVAKIAAVLPLAGTMAAFTYTYLQPEESLRRVADAEFVVPWEYLDRSRSQRPGMISLVVCMPEVVPLRDCRARDNWRDSVASIYLTDERGLDSITNPKVISELPITSADGSFHVFREGSLFVGVAARQPLKGDWRVADRRLIELFASWRRER